MTREYHGDARAWLLWALAAGSLALATRNPIILLLLLLVVVAVGWRLAPHHADWAGGWSALPWILWMVGLSVATSLLVIGPSTNVLIYGLLSALATISLVVVWSVFNRVARTSDLLRHLPGRLRLFGVAGAIALTFGPGLVRSYQEIREAQAVRGHRSRGLRDLVPLVVPLLGQSLERGLTLAEAMEARGFGRWLKRPVNQPPRRSWWSRLSGVGQGWSPQVWRRGGSWRGGLRQTLLTSVIAASGMITFMVLIGARLVGDDSLAYSVYPTMTPPSVSAWGLAGALVLVAPVVAAEAGWE